MKNTKVLIVVITKDIVEPECQQALLNQVYPDYSILTHSIKAKQYFNTNNKKYDGFAHTYLNCSENRNIAKQLALASDADHFLFVDADTVIPPHTITELMLYNKDIIGGYYPINGQDVRYVAGGYIKNKAGQEVFIHCTKPIPGIAEVHMVGLGCMLLSRKVAEEIDFEHGLDMTVLAQDFSKKEPLEEPMPIKMGECMAFGYRAREKGYKLFMNGNIVCKHITTHDHYSRLPNFIPPMVKNTENKTESKEEKKEE